MGRIGWTQRRHRILDCFKQRGMVGLGAVALALGQAVSVQAIDPQELWAPIVGPVVILPHVSLSESYDDNVFLLGDEQGKIDDLLTTLSSGIGLQFGENILDSNYIGLDYTLSQQWYAENSEINSDNHALTFGINYQKEGKFTFTGGDMIRLDNTLLEGRERTFFTDLDKGSPDSKGILIERKSFNDQYRFEYTISPKTSVYAATSYNASDYSEEPHYYYQDVLAPAYRTLCLMSPIGTTQSVLAGRLLPRSSSTAVSFTVFRWSKPTWREWASDRTQIFSAATSLLLVIFQRN